MPGPDRTLSGPATARQLPNRGCPFYRDCPSHEIQASRRSVLAQPGPRATGAGSSTPARACSHYPSPAPPPPCRGGSRAVCSHKP